MSTTPPIDSLDRRLIAATQSGLPLDPEPYRRIAKDLGSDAAEVQHRLRRLTGLGIIRRIGAVPNHYALGYRANGMTVWDIDDDSVSDLGRRIGRLEFVTHCYRRPRRLPSWPYNLFAMVHAHHRGEVEEKADRIAAILGAACRRRDILYSTRILKKTGLRLG